ncbi:MAG: hypothetical protein JWM02_3660 [Frankiales bacterium]|nr:hypothetical protein [Frankiales bacterium]
MSINSRPPTGQVPYPVVLLEGEEKSGKTWAAVTLSISDRVGQTYVLDLGEGSADEYGAIPDVRFEVLEHDGTYAQILAQIEAVRDEAQRAKAADEPPVVLVVDTMTALWDGLKDWVSERARSKPSNQKKLSQDPAAELDVSRNLWNDAASRHARILNILLRFPGIVVMTARGKEVSSTDPSTGQPFRDGRKEYRVEGQKGLAFAATAWVRMSRTQQPIVVGARSVHAGIVPGKDDPKPITSDPENLLEWLIFDALKVDPATAQVRDLKTVTGGALTEDEAGDDPDVLAERQAKAAALAAKPAEVVTDTEWMADWTWRLNGCTTIGQLKGLWGEAAEQRKVYKVSEEDFTALTAMKDEKKAALETPVAVAS